MNNGDAVVYNYVIDDAQTKNLSATVDYKLGEEVQTADHIDLTATVQVLQPDTLSTSGVSAKTYTGWKLDSITINGTKVETLPETVNNGDTIVFHYVINIFGYTVNHIYVARDGSSLVGLSETGMADFGTPMSTLFTTDHTTYDGQNYVLDRVENGDCIIDADATKNYVNVYYDVDELSENPDKAHDDIPDKNQVIFRYVAEAGGSVGMGMEVVTKTDGSAKPTGTTAAAAEGYAFDKWICGEAVDLTAAMETFKATAYTADQTFTAIFGEDTVGKDDPTKPGTDTGDGIPDKYQTIFRYVSAGNGTVTGQTLEVYSDNTHTAKPVVAPKANVTIAAAEGYAFDKWVSSTGAASAKADMADLKVATNVDTVFTVSFDTDVAGAPNPGTGDGTPDKYQTIFRYASAGNGTVTGQLLEVYTDETHTAKPTAIPAANVTITPAAGYAFDFWHDSASNAKSQTADMSGLQWPTNENKIFTVHFAIDVIGGNGGNGDGTPDKYQAEITYEVENGTPSIDKTVVNLYDETGKLSENGTGYLTPDQIPDASPNDGYDPDSLTWDGGAPDTTIAITADTTFRGSFAEMPVQVVETTPEPTEEEIVEEEVPLAQPEAKSAWALVNLILTVLTVIGSILLLIGCFKKKEQAETDENGNVVLDANGEEKLEYTRKNKNFWRISSLIPAIGAVVAFILTENMRNPMIWVDKWTILMVVIALVQVVVAILSKSKKEEPEEEEAVQA